MVVEMDALYEVLTNLLRFRLGRGYSSNAFFESIGGNDEFAGFFSLSSA